MKIGRWEDGWGAPHHSEPPHQTVTQGAGHSQAHILQATQTDHLFNLVSGVSAGKEPACNAEDLGSIPGLGRCSGEGKGYPFQYAGLKNSTDYIVQGVAKSRTRLVA